MKNQKIFQHTLIILIGFIIIFICVFFNQKLKINSYTPASYELIQTEAKLSQEVHSFITAKAPNTKLNSIVFIRSFSDANIDITLPLAQGLLESHYGTIGLARQTNQIFNVGAYNGYLFNDIHSNYKFKHPNASLKSYINLLKKRYLNHKTEEQLFQNFSDQDDKRFATDTNYEANLRSIRQEILTTTKIDSLYKKYIYLKSFQ